MEEQHTFSSGPDSGFSRQTVQQQLPNSTTVLILGILSLVFCVPWISPIGVVLGIIALVFAGRDQRLYREKPSEYTLSSFNNLKAGRTCAIIGLSIAALTMVMVILFIIGVLATASLPFWGMID